MSNRLKFTDTELKDALKMYKKGIPKIKIAEKYKANPKVIFKRIKEKYPQENLSNEIVVKNKLVSKEQYDSLKSDDVNRILQCFESGLKIDKIALTFKVKSNVIRRVLKENTNENLRDVLARERYKSRMNHSNNDEFYDEMNRFL